MSATPALTAELDNITRYNQELIDFKRTWEREQRIRFEEQARHRTELRDSAVRTAFRMGASKSALCRALDTTNRHTVYAILDQMGADDAVIAARISVTFDADTQILSLILNGAVLEGMAAAKDEPVTGTWDFHQVEMGNRRVWASTKTTGKGPFDIQIAGWLNSSDNNVLRQALTDAGIDDIIKSEATNTDQPQDAGTFELTI